MPRRSRGNQRTNEQRLACIVKQIVYTFKCEDCGMKWLKRYTEDHGESYARASIVHRCSRKLLKAAE